MRAYTVRGMGVVSGVRPGGTHCEGGISLKEIKKRIRECMRRLNMESKQWRTREKRLADEALERAEKK